MDSTDKATNIVLCTIVIGIVILFIGLMFYSQHKNEIIAKVLIESNAEPLEVKALFRGTVDAENPRPRKL